VIVVGDDAAGSMRWQVLQLCCYYLRHLLFFCLWQRRVSSFHRRLSHLFNLVVHWLLSLVKSCLGLGLGDWLGLHWHVGDSLFFCYLVMNSVDSRLGAIELDWLGVNLRDLWRFREGLRLVCGLRWVGHALCEFLGRLNAA
jgi:hypothetical protein